MPELNLENNKEINQPRAQDVNKGFDPDKRIDPSAKPETKVSGEAKQYDPDARLKNPRSFDDNGKKFRDKNELLPNNTYELNGYVYETDDRGRITSAEGTLRLKPEGRPRKQITDKLETIAKGDQEKGDQRGHIIGDQFEGEGFGNLIAQSEQSNKEYEKWENEMAASIKAGNKVDVQIDLAYKGDSYRPDALVVSYSINGEGFVKVFKNGSKS